MSHHKKVPPQDLKSLKSFWYQKLKDEGFNDIESFDGKHLNQWDSAYFQLRYTPNSFSAKEAYFYRAEQFLSLHPFKHPIEKEIWKLHAQGQGVRQIATHIGDDPYLSLPLWVQTSDGASNKDSIAEILRPLKARFMQWMRSRSEESDLGE